MLATLAQVLEIAHSAAAGILISGEAGIGKTTLVDAAVGMAEGFEVIRATGVPIDCDMAFAGLAQLLMPLLPFSDSVPERQRLILESALSLAAPPANEELVVAGAVLAVLGQVAEGAPLLIAIDDAQWVDHASLKAVLFALRRMQDEPLALVIATRPLDIDDPLRAAGLREIRLEPLERDAARAVAAAHAAGGVDAAALDRVVGLADGVPLALVELARLDQVDHEALASDGSAGASATQLVERLFGRRVQRLSRSAAMAALLAALDEPDELPAFVTAGDALGVTPAAWQETERAAVLRLSAGRAELVHPLLRAAIVGSATPADLRSAHGALADAMLARGDSLRAAWHQAGAVIGADEAVAAALELAADSYRSRAGYRAAMRALERAAQLSVTAVERGRRLLLAAEAARHAGEQLRAARLAREAAARGDPAIDAQAEMLQAHAEAWQGSAGAAYRRYRRLAEDVADRDPELAAYAYVCAAGVAIVSGQVDRAVDAATSARAVPSTAISRRGSMMVREIEAFVNALSGETAAARPALDELAAWYGQQPERLGAEYVAEALIWLGEHERAAQLLDDLVADARRLGAVAELIESLVMRSELHYRTGAWATALDDASEAVGLATDTEQTVHLAYASAALALLEAMTGRESDAAQNAERARTGAQRHALAVVQESAQFVLGAIELLNGRPQRALTYLLPIAEAVAAAGRGEPGVTLWAAELIEALIGAERREAAACSIDRLDGQARATGNLWAAGVADRYRGMISGAGDFDHIFARAIEAHAASGMPFELARTRFCYGQRLRRAGRRIDARAELRDALATFERLRATPWLERTERELAGSGETLRRSATLDRDELTPKELQIARAVAAGASNNEAAADMFLSPKTIETHLSRIYRKLGIRSRNQLTLMMNDPRLLKTTQP